MKYLCATYAVVVMFASLLDGRCVHAEGDPATRWKLQLRAEHSTFPLGIAVPLVFDFCNDGPGETRFVMDHLGFPKGMEISLTSPDGKDTEIHSGSHLLRSTSGYDPPEMVPPADMLLVPEKSCVRLAYELNHWFSLDQAGRYSVRIRYNQAELVQFNFEMVRLDVSEEIRVTGHINGLPQLRPVVEQIVPAQCRVQIGVAAVDGDQQWFIVVEGTRIGRQQEDGHEFLLRVPPDTRVMARSIDVRWRLWMLLKSGEESAVVIGNLRDGTAHTAIDWTQEKIFFRNTWAQNPFKGMVIAAGTAGEPMLSTLSEAASFQGRSISLLK